MPRFATSLELLAFDDIPEGAFKDHMRGVVVPPEDVDYYRLRMFQGETDVEVYPVFLAHVRSYRQFKVSEGGRGPEAYFVEPEGICRSAHLWYMTPGLLTPVTR